MAGIAWRFYIYATSTEFTSSVISWSGTTGRQNYMDNYNGGTFNITIKNQSNLAASFTRGARVDIRDINNYALFNGRVSQIEFDDYPGNIGLSTATITLMDATALAGRYYLSDYTGYTAATTCAQAQATNPDTTTFDILANPGNSNASAVASYSGTILNRLNILNNTEKGQLDKNSDQYIYFKNRYMIASAANLTNYTFGRAPGTNSYGVTIIVYSDFRRIQNGDNFMNVVQVAPEAVASQTATNTTSVTAYGSAGYQVTTADSTTDQALGLASWLANMQGDPATLRYEVTVSDATASQTAVQTFLYDYLWSSRTLSAITYRVPGASVDTTANVVIEGIMIQSTPVETVFTLYMSPAEFYQYFILNNSTFGILNTSRLGW